MKSKYIVIKQDTLDYPFVFSELSVHADVGRALGGQVIAAGFCFIQDNAYICYGESISLNVKSRGKEDSDLLNCLLGVD